MDKGLIKLINIIIFPFLVCSSIEAYALTNCDAYQLQPDSQAVAPCHQLETQPQQPNHCQMDCHSLCYTLVGIDAITTSAPALYPTQQKVGQYLSIVIEPPSEPPQNA